MSNLPFNVLIFNIFYINNRAWGKLFASVDNLFSAFKMQEFLELDSFLDDISELGLQLPELLLIFKFSIIYVAP